MNVLVTTRYFPSRFCGIAGAFVQEHVDALRAATVADWGGDSIDVIHVDDFARFGTVCDSHGALHLGTHIERRLVRGVVRRLRFVMPVLVAIMAWRLQRRRNVDAVVSVGAPVDVPAWIVARMLRARFACHIEHSTDFLRTDPAYPVRRGQRSRRSFFLRRAGRVVAVSETLAHAMSHDFGVPAQNIRIVPNVVNDVFLDCDSDAATPIPLVDDSTLRLLAVSMLVRPKRVELIIDAAALLARDRPVRLDIVGDGPERAELEKRVADLGIESIVRFHGLLDKSEIARLASQASVFVMASLHETFCVALAEALCMGLPLVSTRSGGPESYLPDAHVTWVNSPTAASVADCVQVEVRRDRPDRRSDARSYGASLFGREAVGRALRAVVSGTAP